MLFIRKINSVPFNGMTVFGSVTSGYSPVIILMRLILLTFLKVKLTGLLPE